MATNTDTKGARICVRLDPGLLLEALILKQLNRLPKCRHPDWIRSLLVQGFLAESRVLRQLKGTVAQTPVAEPQLRRPKRSGFDFASWFGSTPHPMPVMNSDHEIPPNVSPVPVQPSSTHKPFAYLRKVVG